MIEMARSIALKAHGDQKYGILPYSYHLAAVVDRLKEVVGLDPVLLSAGWLHDTLEDTTETVESLARYGIPQEAITLVNAVTDGKGGNRKERKERPYDLIPKTTNSVLIKLADRLANVEESLRNQNMSMFSMYRKEHVVFSERLRGAPVNGDFNAGLLWARLDRHFANE